ncbi:MAG: tetratricopeptide repeat protein [Woeseiaceae bacterium]|nr:tetratricopeptide repeat protein [Woeseiaceae bacterium]
MSGLYQEFKRRNVFRVAVAYAVMSWLVVQVADIAVPALRLPDWVTSMILLILALGFVPTLVFAWAFELTPDGIKREKDVDRSKSITAETGRKLNQVTLAALALVVVIVIADRFVFPDERSPRPASAPGEDLSIAVLPFVDMSPEKDQGYFSDGITEEILNGLAKIEALKVAGRTSSFAFKGRNEDLREIGTALGVRHVLEGSVRKAGDRIRITAQLIDVEDGFHRWSDTWDRQLEDIFAIQDEISAAIVGELRGKMLGEVTKTAPAESIDIALYEQFLEARELIHTRNNENLLEAKAMLERIVAQAPDFAPGLTNLAEAVLLLRNDSFISYGDMDPAEARVIATPLIERAIELDPGYAHAWAVQGLLYYSDRNFEAGEDSLRRAVELNPSSSSAWNWRSNIASTQGRVQDSIEYLREATRVDPLWLVPNSNLVGHYLELGRTDEAWEILERLRPFHQDSASFHRMDANLHAAGGALADAHRASLKAFELSPDTPANAARLAFSYLDLQEFAKAVEFAPTQFAPMHNFVSGEWDELVPRFRELLENDPLNGMVLFIYLIGATYIGDFEGVAAFYDKHIEGPQTLLDGGQGDLLAKFVPALRALGRDEQVATLLEAERLRLLRRESEGERGSGIENAWSNYYAFTGDFDRAFEHFERAIRLGLRIPVWAYAFEWRPVMNDSRFIAIRKKNRDAINAERTKLGWEPVAEIGVFIEPGAG